MSSKQLMLPAVQRKSVLTVPCLLGGLLDWSVKMETSIAASCTAADLPVVSFTC